MIRNEWKDLRPAPADVAPRRARRARRRCAARLVVEEMEARTTPATFTVNTFADTVAVNLVTGQDSSGNVSLRSALMAANSQSGADTIVLPAGTYALTLAGPGNDNDATGELDITDALTLRGAGPAGTVIDASGLVNARAFHVEANITVALSGVTITGGNEAPLAIGGEIPGQGGGIYSAGTLTLTNCVLSHNQATGDVGSAGYYIPPEIVFPSPGGPGEGGGLYVAGGSASITGSTFLANQATGGRGGDWHGLGTTGGAAGGQGAGGGLYAAGGVVDVTDSTFSGNQATGGPGGSPSGGGGQGRGGGIYDASSGLTITDSTLSGNSATTSGGGISAAGTMTITGCTLAGNTGDVAVSGATVQVRNTIVAGNVAGTVASQGHNLIGDGTGSSGWTATDLVGTATNPINPQLGPLQNNGGPTETMALLLGSPAIGAGDPSGAPQWDQRGPGFPRVVHGRIDIGAFQVQQAGASLVGRDPGTGEWWTALSNGTNGFTNVAAAAWDPSATWVDVQTGDFNGDGFTDIVGRDLRSGQWWVGLSDGHGHFTTSRWATWSPAVHWVDFKVGDFDGDGRMDIAGRVEEDGSWWVGRSTGSSFVTSKWGTWNPGAVWKDVQVGDLTGNGKDDLIGRTPGGQWWAALSTGSAFTNTLWTTWAPDAPNLTWVDVHLADVTGDGKADLVGRYLQMGQWWVTVSGASTAGSTTLWTTWDQTVNWVDVGIGDFTGDGKADLIGRDPSTGNWWVGTSTGTAFANHWWATWVRAVPWLDVQVGDFNSDGRMDIAGRAPDGSWWVSMSTSSSFVTSWWGDWDRTVNWADVYTGSFG
jgi:predicted outer membrane repeat protein